MTDRSVVMPASTRQQRLAAQKDHTRGRILQAARTVFAARGYHGTTMDDVAREAGLSKGALYVHFPGKEDLFVSLVEDCAAALAERVLAAIGAAEGGANKVAAALRAAVEAFSENESLTRLLLIEAVGLSPALEQKRFALQAALTSLVQRHLDDAASDGDIPQQDTALAAAAWIGAVNEVVVRWLHARQPARLLDVVSPLTTLLLRSVGFPEERR
ncbi:MAG: TetR/AcrR family transcriptional regulator [Armatimonadota bacterium]|nr:TetR/AcrR family transcriptional regulator [Armatimonadota bacterium]MDR5696889.1 TetR/AcrR family transcriptional regulator [Armatimonadota bacterium]